MTRKDYINIAAAIRATQVRIEGEFDERIRSRLNATAPGTAMLQNSKSDQLRGVRRTAAHLAAFLADDNPRFDQGMFLTNCGYGAMTMNPRDPALDLRPLGKPQEAPAEADDALAAFVARRSEEKRLAELSDASRRRREGNGFLKD